MRNASFNRFAVQELREAALRYEDEAPGLGSRFLEEVEAALAFLSEFPEAAQEVDEGVRRLVLPRFPYSLLYRPLGEGRIRLLAVSHQSRRPEHWVGRQ
jgi:toxin ParE1/3/4